MAVSPAAMACLVTGAAQLVRRLELSARVLRYEAWVGSAAGMGMTAFLSGALCWVTEGGPGPQGLFHAGIIDVTGLAVMTAALLTGVCVFLILLVEQYGFRNLELVIMGLVAIIGVAYAIEVFLVHPAWGAIGRGVVVPEVNSSSIYVVVGMLGATVMPHVVYLHSALVQPRRETTDHRHTWHRKMALLDVLVAMNGAWLVNSAMVVMAAAAFFGHGLNVESIREAHSTLEPLLGGLAAAAFAIALLASGLSSSTVGTMAGQVIIEGFLKIRFSIFLRRLLTMIPALVVIAFGLDPLKILILSQVVLSFCLPFALIPLLMLTRRRDVMGIHVNKPWTNLLAWATTTAILALNALLIAQALGASF
ncbi:MAG TPA: divalent metal cation transporter [Actinobacteria bacterium]|nr:divalent metal cation transporter [Actinomycetota bacterium]